MFGLYTYQLYEIERPKTVAEARAADVRRGEFAATLSSLRAIFGRTRSLASDRRPELVAVAPAHCPDSVPVELVTACASASCSSDWDELSGTAASPARVG
ncbi:MAG TPA: hypothetical protein VGI58_13415 [Streptosporangiaceae bacterium]|jgi:hypothetical protein